MNRVLGAVERIVQTIGSYGRWLVVILILVQLFEISMRYIFRSPTNWAYETSMMLGGTMYALGWSYALLHRSHVRVDIFFSRLSRRGQAIADAVLSIGLFFPLVSVLSYRAIFWAHRAYMRGEVLMDSTWFPPAWPYKSILAIGFCLLLIMGLVKLIRDIQVAGRGTEA